ncbi:carboxymuconolactone decarboxylase family protein [Streptomyces roseoverticillatus]|uniref:carboxymuconolactone decarboxylase family protein n=1 Tax=Streptomyces roseoverticillatus TaxID=66429 RepID=UPI001F430397|nr:carboxymuconolactone decarboxylase family protein [Streptomyces roseoverticillatus]MCF3106576.1 carboxymuconolactone decarboxylase family protein [Streptomyces roseoverticillatus]
MARISLTPDRTPLIRIMEWYSRRTYGKVLEPLMALAHNRRVLLTTSRFELSVGRWKKLDPQLKALAEMASAAAIGCSWCMDFGYWLSRGHGLPHEKLQDVPVWRESRAYAPLERDVMAYAEAMTATPPTVEDDLAERLRQRLGDAAFVELTSMIAVENLRSRTNAALGLHSQGFKDTCDMPAAPARPQADRTPADH